MKKLIMPMFSAILLTIGASVAFATAYDDLAKLVKSGLSEDILTAYIDAYPTAFNLTADQVVSLKGMGATQGTITEALGHKESVAAAITADSAKPQSPPVNQTSGTVIYQTVAPYGKWVWVDDDWFWYPWDAVIDVAWWPFYGHYGFHGYRGYGYHGYYGGYHGYGGGYHSGYHGGNHGGYHGGYHGGGHGRR